MTETPTSADRQRALRLLCEAAGLLQRAHQYVVAEPARFTDKDCIAAHRDSLNATIADIARSMGIDPSRVRAALAICASPTDQEQAALVSANLEHERATEAERALDDATAHHKSAERTRDAALELLREALASPLWSVPYDTDWRKRVRALLGPDAVDFEEGA